MTARPAAVVHQLLAGNAKHQAARAAQAEQAALTRVRISETLAQLRGLSARLAVLSATNQTSGRGVITEEVIELANKQAGLDRAAAHGLHQQREHNGLTWLNPTAVLGTGQIEAPVAVPAASASAEILFALQQHVRRLGRPFRKAHSDVVRDELEAGACAWPRPWFIAHPINSDGDIPHLAAELMRLVNVYTSLPGLEGILRDLDRLEERARDVVEGPARSSWSDPCPWCDRKTLVVHHRDPGRSDMFVRCDGRHRCECDDPLCDCHRNPHRNRHEWINSGSAKNTVDGRSQHSLVSLITRKKELAILEPKALAAIERIRQMHQPTYEVGGVARRHYVQVGSDVPSDHVCVIDGDDHCDPEYEDHIALACVECRFATEDGHAGYAFWPCPTARACDLDADPDSHDTTTSPE